MYLRIYISLTNLRLPCIGIKDFFNAIDNFYLHHICVNIMAHMSIMVDG
jgi:hypothetical protein